MRREAGASPPSASPRSRSARAARTPAGGTTALPGRDAGAAAPPATRRWISATLRGPAVVNLWATWCAPCRRELPAFQEVSERRPDVRFVGIDIGEDAAKAEDFIDELGITFEQFVDERGELTDALGAAALPVTLVVDTDGTRGDRAPRADDGR